MGPTKNATKKACIATAIVLLGFGIVGAPTAVAEESEPQPGTLGGSQADEDCYEIDPWSFPPIEVDVEDCL